MLSHSTWPVSRGPSRLRLLLAWPHLVTSERPPTKGVPIAAPMAAAREEVEAARARVPVGAAYRSAAESGESQAGEQMAFTIPRARTRPRSRVINAMAAQAEPMAPPHAAKANAYLMPRVRPMVSTTNPHQMAAMPLIPPRIPRAFPIVDTGRPNLLASKDAVNASPERRAPVARRCVHCISTHAGIDRETVMAVRKYRSDPPPCVCASFATDGSAGIVATKVALRGSWRA